MPLLFTINVMASDNWSNAMFLLTTMFKSVIYIYTYIYTYTCMYIYMCVWAQCHWVWLRSDWMTGSNVPDIKHVWVCKNIMNICVWVGIYWIHSFNVHISEHTELFVVNYFYYQYIYINIFLESGKWKVRKKWKNSSFISLWSSFIVFSISTSDCDFHK